METIIKIRNFIIGFVYRAFLKPIFFMQDPETVHDRITALGNFFGRDAVGRILVKTLFNYQNPILSQTIAGINFKNPLGLAAGFDKEALLTEILPAVGFGFEEIGSITGRPCAGNPKPRLWRLKSSNSLVVYYGLKNGGCEKIVERLKDLKLKIPTGVSIAKTNSPETVSEESGIADYVKAY
ncbi:MAG: quinone-dependent dihydroorotate dehydrogenase, partial [Patescibacteria group bacterium]|nr:quinone-dependent dihydroorotate dehydrogenase [Patescibacteria group bacterium]